MGFWQMDQMPLSAVIFDSIPESILLFSFGMAVVGEYINFKKILIASIISAFTSMLIRAYVPIFGLHSIIGIFVLFVLFWKLLNLKPWKAIISSLISLMVLLLLDTIILSIILKAENITVEEVLKDTYRRIIYPVPIFIIFGLTTWFLYTRKKFLIRGSRIGKDEPYNKARFLVSLAILFQGVFLFVINEHLNYLGKYTLLIKLVCTIYFIASILFLKRLYGGDRPKKV
ncbi:MAG: hypothetical protein VR69_05030 [Peptococcaceae bacterium BRH_c4b]|nr:MAG: hypothetical protein VR69_05030 [Peptococcaceae bacterium BRH_c4b]